MADAIVRATALRWVSDDQPGVVEVGIVDGDGREHRIIEKVPVLTTGNLTSTSEFPAELWIRADTDTVEGERVQVTLAHSVKTIDGLTGLILSDKDVKWL